MHPQSHRSCPCVLLAVLLGLVVDVTRGSWSIQPIPQYPAIRGSVTLSPTGINEKVTSVVWFKGTDTNPPSQILTYIAAGSYTISGALHSPRFSAFSNGSLHITDLLLTDQGEYTVKVQAEKTSMDLRVTLTVHEPVTKPKITASTPQPKENEPLTLTCVTSHAVTITWTRRGTSISSGAKLSGDNKTLTFSSITRGDSGEYQCGAQNLVSKDVSDPHAVSVLYGPSEARIEGEVFVRPGSSITLTCSADSYPPPEFQWKVNDTDTGAKTSKYGVSNAETQDQGLYTCVVRNPATLRTATTAVYVNVTAVHDMESVRKIFHAAMPSQSFSIYRGVEEEDEAELHIEDFPRTDQRSSPKASRFSISPQYQKLIIAVIVTGFIAFLLGYISTRRPCTTCDSSDGDFTSDESYEQGRSEPVTMDWSELKDLFTKYLTDGEHIEENIRKFSRAPHPSGSQENSDLADSLLQTFRGYNMDHTWVDSHFAELQFPNRSQPNSLNIVNGSEIVERIPIGDPDVYCPYSASKTAEGGLIYVNYGRQEDFQSLKDWGVQVTGSLVIVRTGLLSFAEKVYNAERAGALGVLIFPDYAETSVYGHVHFGTGDPNTPGFPSFNHTQFPPFKSSGLPNIPAQPISLSAARSLLGRLSGPTIPDSWRAADFLSHGVGPKMTTSSHKVQLKVSNEPVSVELHNVFGSITGRSEPEHYIVVGAQRDSWGPGAAKSGVGTAILLELARTMTMMVHNGFQPRRTILFVSWDGGDFGSIGATEWLEGYLSMLHLKAAAYMSLDTPVLGDENFLAKTSPLFINLIENIIKQVDNPRQSKQSIYDYMKMKGSNWKAEVTAPLKKDSSAFAFTAFAGVPALEFSFIENSQPYKFLDTKQDTYDSLNQVMYGRLPSVALCVAQVAGLSLIKLSHDHILPLDYTAYKDVLLKHLITLQTHEKKLKSRGLSLEWLYSARGDYMRATQRLKKAISQSDLHNEKVIQFFNVRIMRVEFYFLSQYVSAVNSPYRHILLGRGEHTLEALLEHLNRAQNDIDDNELHKQIALFTWTLEGAANALSGEVWEVQRSF